MWDTPSEDAATEEDSDDIGAKAEASWQEQEARLLTAAGINTSMRDDDFGFGETPGPRHYIWGRALGALIEDVAASTFDIAPDHGPEGSVQPHPLDWQRAIWAFDWPLVDATAERALTPCRIRVWTSPGIPEMYQSAHDSGDIAEFVEMGERMSALRAWDTTEPWNTYLIHVHRASATTYTAHDCAWWQTRPADYFTKPESIVAAMARIFPAKGWRLSQDR